MKFNSVVSKPVCGLDFGTSNSTIGFIVDGKVQLTPFESGEPRLRSAIFYNTETQQLIFGDHGVQQYLLGEPGRLMMSLKSLLGSSLLNEQTAIGQRLVPYTEIIGAFIGYLKKQAEKRLHQNITGVVLGRPVVFHPDPEKDQLAQDTLEAIAKSQGFTDIFFQYEPLAAGFAYEATLHKEELVLVIDMGGGTSDFSIIKLGGGRRSPDRNSDILANHGIRIAGTDFDRKLSLATVMPLLGMHSSMRGSSGDIEVPDTVYHELTSWHLLRKLYSRQVIGDVKRIFQVAHQKYLIQRLLNVLIRQEGHRILHIIETAKKSLSELNCTPIDLNFIEEDLVLEATRQQFNQSIAEYRQQLLDSILETVRQAAIVPNEIEAIFYTGGTTLVPVIREEIKALFPQAKIVQGDIFGSVGVGLTLDAMRRF